jgi:hypothetical protein
MTARSEPFRLLCRYTPCFVDLPHDCVMYQGCEAMHLDSSMWGRGMGHKSTDMCAAGCRNAHALLTGHVGDNLEREVKQGALIRAVARTFDFWLEHGWIRAETTKARREGTCLHI